MNALKKEAQSISFPFIKLGNGWTVPTNHISGVNQDKSFETSFKMKCPNKLLFVSVIKFCKKWTLSKPKMGKSEPNFWQCKAEFDGKFQGT
jgi:hypothetical protein